MLTETSVTLYNAVTDKDTGRTVYLRTVIPAAHWEDHRGISGTGTSHPSANSVNVFIPIYIADQMQSRFVSPEVYAATPEESRQSYWTLAKGDLLLKGTSTDEIGGETGFKEFLAQHREAVSIQGVDTADYGSYAMRHWEVTAT